MQINVSNNLQHTILNAFLKHFVCIHDLFISMVMSLKAEFISFSGQRNFVSRVEHHLVLLRPFQKAQSLFKYKNFNNEFHAL